VSAVGAPDYANRARAMLAAVGLYAGGSPNVPIDTIERKRSALATKLNYSVTSDLRDTRESRRNAGRAAI
jgi:hypothetical protein